MRVRPAVPSDLPGILAIYNEVIRNSAAVYALDPVTLDERRAWFEGRQALGYPALVAAGDDDVLGFASFEDWRGAWPGYRDTVERSVHVRADRRGSRTGSGLVEALLPLALDLGKHVLIGGIDAPKTASLRFHERPGFPPAAPLP